MLKAFSYAGYVIGFLAVIAVVVVFVHRYREYRHQQDMPHEGGSGSAA